MTPVSYPRTKILSLLKQLNSLLILSKQVSNQKLYFGVLKIQEELTKTKQILGDNHE